MLRKIFGPKRDEVTGEWRKLHNEELNDLYSSPNIIRVIKSRIVRWAWHVVCLGEGRGAYRVLVGKPEGKRPLGRPRRRWEDNIKMDLQEVGYGGMDWIELAQDRDRWWVLVNAVTNLRVLSNAGNFFISWEPVLLFKKDCAVWCKYVSIYNKSRWYSQRKFWNVTSLAKLPTYYPSIDPNYSLTTSPTSCADCIQIWKPHPPGTLRVSPGIALPLVGSNVEVIQSIWITVPAIARETEDYHDRL